MNQLRLFIILFCFLYPGFSLYGQTIIGQVEVKEFDGGVNDYPYEVGGYYGNLAYVMHQPALRLSEGEFAHIWHPSKSGYRERIVVKYNMLLEEMWRVEFKLENEEDIVHAFSNDTAIVLLTNKYFYNDHSHRIFRRTISLDSGRVSTAQIIHQINGKNNQELMISEATDKKSILIYHYELEKPKGRLRVLRDYLYTNETLGYRITGAEKMVFRHFDLDLNELNQGEIWLNPIPKNKSSVFSCQLDPHSNIYVSIYDKPSVLRVIRYNCESKDQQSISYDDFPDYWYEQDPYMTHVPPVIGSSSRVYIGMAERVKLRSVWQTQSYTVVTLDFNTGLVDESRQVETNSTLLVKASKIRQAFGSKPAKTFDKYLIKDIIEMSNGHVWLMTQKYDYDYHSSGYAAPNANYRISYKIEELIFYEFDQDGEFLRSLIVPSYQRTEEESDYAGLFYSLNIDRESQEINMLTHEMTGEKLTQPPRTFYRKIDLVTGTFTPRVQVFEGKRRIQNFFKYYTVWLNPTVAILVVEDGSEGRTYLLSVDLLGEAEEHGEE